MDGCGGLTTAEALQKLYDDIREAVEFECRGAEDYRSGDFCVGVILKSLKSKNPTFTHQRLLLFLLLLKSGCLVMSHVFLPPQNSSTLLLEAFLIFSAGVGNFTLFCWDDWLRKVEMPSRARWLLGVLREWKDKCCWYPDHYPHIHTPQSPSISLQATFRDGNIVNLPWALLVKGDLIVLRPGQTAPGRCHSIKDDTFTLEADDIFSPPIDDQSESLRNPRLRRPLQCGYCQLDETPYVNSVRIVMKEALNRPASVFQKEKHLIFTVCMEKIAAPIFLVLILVVNLVRYFYTSGWHSSGHWADMFLLQPCSILIPLVPLLLPLAWLTMNAFGLAWILALFYTARQYKMSNDPFEDADVTDVPLTHSTFSMKCQETRAYFVDTLLGRGKSPFRTENLLQTLASALCCIDKKGILSWPNPTAEKVFFLRNSKFSSGAVEMCSVPSLDPSLSRSGSSKDRVGDTKMETARHKRTSKRELTVGDTTAEVLDLSHDCTTPFRLQFDDPSWQQYLDSLKPLGLAILLNTCNPMSYERYAQFCSHLSSLGQFHEDLVPVVNRRRCEKGRPDINLCESRTHLTMPTHGCLCELAKQIGFQSGARNIFSLKEQLFTFRHQADLARKDRLARSLSLPKLKFPFPNMVGICVQESSSGRLQLLSQGTGEILLDACVDYWNGSDLCPLTSTDRKRILDFYNRSSLTAYCTAFAYRPLSGRMINATGNEAVRLFGGAGVYLELPSDSAHLYQPQRSPDTPALWESTAAGSMRSDSRIQSDGNLYNSSALAGGYLSRSNDSLLADMTEEDAQSAQGVFNVTCNQTFVAMVTMQYQARTDMVQLIEQMDKACIRFVHFSKENELRSRVFSEKMGLESGWNCHISLLSDKADNEDNSADAGKQRHQKSMASLAAKDAIRDDTVAVARNALTSLEQCRPLSVSAPSAINVEMVQVKFEDEISLHSLTDSDDEREKLFGDRKDDAGIVSMKTPSPHRHHFNLSQNSSLDCSSSSLVLLNDVQGADSSCCDVNLSRSQSHVTESTEQSAPVAFDMSNRAKLPRGIDEIRPHIENVDNVPLLVSLFTDCTPSATRQMIQIMQDNGEVVCIVGSSASGHNTPIFMQADASLAVEPLYPQVCQQVPVCEAMSEANAPSPVELSRRLNSLPCALSFHRDELPSTLLHLVLESRHIGFYIRNVLQLWAASAASLSLIQLMAAFLFLPPILTTGQVLWLACVTVPLLSVSLIGAPTDPSVMNVATGKNYRHLDRETLSFVAWCYSCKLLPSLIMLVVIFCAALMDVCTKVSAACVQTGQCVWIYPSRNGSVVQGLWSGWGEPAMRDYLYQIQHWIALAYVLYLVFISMSFIHRQYHLWQRNPFSNRLWVAICVLVICLQVLYFTCSVFLFADGAIKSDCDLRISVPWPSWLVFLWPVPLLGFNELVKHYEIKVNVRLQKRARLEFGTKLGMNSPF